MSVFTVSAKLSEYYVLVIYYTFRPLWPSPVESVSEVPLLLNTFPCMLWSSWWLPKRPKHVVDDKWILSVLRVSLWQLMQTLKRDLEKWYLFHRSEVLYISWNGKIHFRFYNSKPVNSATNHMKSIQTLTLCPFNKCFYSSLWFTPRSLTRFYSFQHQIFRMRFANVPRLIKHHRSFHSMKTYTILLLNRSMAPNYICNHNNSLVMANKLTITALIRSTIQAFLQIQFSGTYF